MVGVTSFSLDLQAVIDRSLSIAALPLAQLQNERDEMLGKETALASVDAKFEALQAAIKDLKVASSGNSFSATVSDESVVTATAGGSALPGSYSVEVINLGSQTTTLSTAGLLTVTDPGADNISSSSSFTLTVNGTDFAIEPSGGSLIDLANAINSSDAAVTATVINIGPSSAPDYKLTLQSQDLGAVDIQLNDGGQDLLDTVTNGTELLYRVNGQPSTPIASTSRTVILSPGLTAEFTGTGTSEIEVNRSPSSLSDAVTAFVSSFNDALFELDLHRGKDAAALSGESIVPTLSRALGSLGVFSSGTGPLSVLADIGVTLDSTGLLTFDETVVSSATSEQMEDILTFLGDGETNGFVQFATDLLDTIEDTDRGLVELAIDSLDESIERQDDLIFAEQERLENLAGFLEARIAAAEVLIASLEQQAIQVETIFEAMRQSNE